MDTKQLKHRSKSAVRRLKQEFYKANDIKRASFWDSYNHELLKDIVTIKLNDLNR